MLTTRVLIGALILVFVARAEERELCSQISGEEFCPMRAQDDEVGLIQLQGGGHAASMSLQEQGEHRLKVDNVTCKYGDYEFTCDSSHQCCGRLCLDKAAVCCENAYAVQFPCDQYSSCCGNACAGLNSKCCTDVRHYRYPVPNHIPCETPDLSYRCVNRFEQAFPCYKQSSCCEDICVGPNGMCCFNSVGMAFACGEGSACCGDACAGPGDKCCVDTGIPTPLSKHTECMWEYGFPMKVNLSEEAHPNPGSHQTHEQETENPGSHQTHEQETKNPGSHQTHEQETKNPGSHQTQEQETEIFVEPEEETLVCRHKNYTFDCAKGSTCCGPFCAGWGDSCCFQHNEYSKCIRFTRCCKSMPGVLVCALPGGHCPPYSP